MREHPGGQQCLAFQANFFNNFGGTFFTASHFCGIHQEAEVFILHGLGRQAYVLIHRQVGEDVCDLK